MGNLKIMKYLIMLFLGWMVYLFHVYSYVLCIGHPISVCGDDRVIYYPGAVDVSCEPEDD